MPLVISYPNDGEGIEVCAFGDINPKEILEAYKEIYSEENINNRRYFLIDRSECYEQSMSNEGIQKIAALDKYALDVNPNLVIAHIAPTDFQYGLSRIWQAYIGEDQLSIEIFRDRKSAEAWINSRQKN